MSHGVQARADLRHDLHGHDDLTILEWNSLMGAFSPKDLFKKEELRIALLKC